MGFRLQDLPVYILMGAAIGFFAYVIIQSWRQEKKDRDQKNIKK